MNKNHKIDCKCCFCKAKRGEMSGKNNSFYKKHHTDETKELLRIKMTGKTHVVSEATKIIIGKEVSIALKERFKNGAKPWNYGLTKETDIRVRKNAKGTKLGVLKLWKNNLYKKKQSISHWSKNDSIREKVRKSCLNVSCKPNRLEQSIGEVLNKKFNDEFLYVGNKRFGKSGLNPDFIHKNKNLVVLCNGVYWHLKKLNIDDTHENRIKAMVREAKLLNDENFSVMIVWEDGMIQFSLSGNISPISTIVNKFANKNIFQEEM